MKFRVTAKELVLGGRLTHGDGNDAGGTGTFHARQIATQRTKFLFLLVKLLLGWWHELELRLLGLISHGYLPRA